ncbi:hypothetical protein CTI12_AA404270 [Artemisia annua]|uniref:Uncharacterized protein n=1 Tax=Artemisia annua TaxID=35608 RepID=A0A2U1M925_ARTAN|nr:hypothetical protein CTI12_AA404270 [Artemisia annua]
MPCTTKALDSLVEQKMTFNSMAEGTSVSGSIQDSRTGNQQELNARMKSVDRKHHWTQISREPTPFTPSAYIVDHTNVGEVVKDNNATAVQEYLDNDTNDFFDAQESLSGTSSTDDEITSGLERYVSLCSLLSKFHDARGDKLVYNLGSEMEDLFDTQDSSSVTSGIDDEITFEFHEAREAYSIDKGNSKAEIKAKMESQLESTNMEIARLTLLCYEVVNKASLLKQATFLHYPTEERKTRLR